MKGFIQGIMTGEMAPADRAQFNDALQYIDNQHAQVAYIANGLDAIETESNKLNAKATSLHRTIEEITLRSKQLTGSLTQLQNSLSQLNNIQTEAERAWDTLVEVEKRLMEHPMYSSYLERGKDTEESSP